MEIELGIRMVLSLVEWVSTVNELDDVHDRPNVPTLSVTSLSSGSQFSYSTTVEDTGPTSLYETGVDWDVESCRGSPLDCGLEFCHCGSSTKTKYR